MSPRARDDVTATMPPPPATHGERRSRYHESSRPPAPPHSQSYGHPQQQPYPPHGSVRIPPSPRDYPYYEGHPPPRWEREQMHPHHPYYGYDVRYHHQHPRDDRPFLPPMNHPEQQEPRMAPAPLPNSEEYSPRREHHQHGPPPIQYRPSDSHPGKSAKRHDASSETNNPSPASAEPETAAPPAPSSPQKPGALSLLAKVASGNPDRPNQSKEEQSPETAKPEFASPVRRTPHSPGDPVIWTPTRSPYPQQHIHAGRPAARRPGEWREGPYPPQRAEYWTYEGPETPPVLGQPVSFDEGSSYHHSPPQQQQHAHEEYQQHPPTPRGYPEYRHPHYEYPPHPPPPPPPPEYYQHYYPQQQGYSEGAGGQHISPSASRDMEPEVQQAPPPPAQEKYHYPHPRQSQYTSYMQRQEQEKRANGEKVVLRKKFSWKNYPEMEKFLIANRDDYLRHSALNYTAEQKQFNNDLTDRLLEVAERYGYVFDPDEFNYVGIRDRIRCYYKSYVQTMRKRGKVSKAKTAAAARKRAQAQAAILASVGGGGGEHQVVQRSDPNDLPEYKEDTDEINVGEAAANAYQESRDSKQEAV